MTETAGATWDIYRVTHVASGMKYIGCTRVGMAARWKAHVAGNTGAKLAKAIREFGPSAFVVERLQVASSKVEAESIEAYWISFYRATQIGYGFNTRHGTTRPKMRSISLRLNRAQFARLLALHAKVNAGLPAEYRLPIGAVATDAIVRELNKEDL